MLAYLSVIDAPYSKGDGEPENKLYLLAFAAQLSHVSDQHRDTDGTRKKELTVTKTHVFGNP